MSNLLQQTRIEVEQLGALVVLTLGDLRFSIEFHVALQISAALRAQAAIAKLQSGDFTRRLQGFGVLHDASAPVRAHRFAEKLPALLRLRDIDVSTEGTLVVLRFGRTTAKLPYVVARTLSQWLRVRAKQAKQYEGETRHWSEIEGMAEPLKAGRVS